MRVCGIDLETDGLDIKTSCITEVAWIIKDIGDPKALIQKSFFMHGLPHEIRPEITELTKITRQHIEDAGCDWVQVLRELADDIIRLKVDYVVAHNGENFDRPMLAEQMKNFFVAEHGITSKSVADAILQTPWLDTRNDIEYPPSWSRSLRYVAAELGFLNPFPHSALFDVATMLKVLECFDINEVIARNKEPWVVLKACTPYEEREKAKKRRFSWEQCGDKTYPKTWVKRVKASDVQREISDADFKIVILEE